MKDKKTLRREMKAVRAAVEGARRRPDRRSAKRCSRCPKLPRRKGLIRVQVFRNGSGYGRHPCRTVRRVEGGLPSARGERGDGRRPLYGAASCARRVRHRRAVPRAVCRRADVCVAPLLAADGQFRRLGYGGGYYDRYFAREGRGAFKIGICYDVQLIKTIPAEAHDARLDVIVTDKRVLRREKAEEQ